MKKNQARKKYKAFRNKLSNLKIKKLSNQIFQQSLKLKIWNKYTYMLYRPIKAKKEVDLSGFFKILNSDSKNILYPKINFKKNIINALLSTNKTKFEINKFGIEEPCDNIIFDPKMIEVVFVPLLSFDIEGNRVGYGAGFYDKFLKECDYNILKIGLSFFEPETRIEDTNASDIKLDYCITPQKVFSF